MQVLGFDSNQVSALRASFTNSCLFYSPPSRRSCVRHHPCLFCTLLDSWELIDIRRASLCQCLFLDGAKSELFVCCVFGVDPGTVPSTAISFQRVRELWGHWSFDKKDPWYLGWCTCYLRWMCKEVALLVEQRGRIFGCTPHLLRFDLSLWFLGQNEKSGSRFWLDPCTWCSSSSCRSLSASIGLRSAFGQSNWTLLASELSGG